MLSSLPNRGTKLEWDELAGLKQCKPVGGGSCRNVRDQAAGTQDTQELLRACLFVCVIQSAFNGTVYRWGEDARVPDALGYGVPKGGRYRGTGTVTGYYLATSTY
eukprot:scaffold5141_cov150-Isochrysis_galbana.AAC.2